MATAHRCFPIEPGAGNVAPNPPLRRCRLTTLRARAHPHRIPLSNDHSKTAAQAQKAGAKILDKAEKDTVKWLEAVIGDYLPDGSLQEALRNGQILCDVMNKVCRQTPTCGARCPPHVSMGCHMAL